jgi:hypothetical protein
MRITPNANVTVVQIGKPSGMAATAKLTPNVNISNNANPRNHPTNTIKAMNPTDP